MCFLLLSLNIVYLKIICLVAPFVVTTSPFVMNFTFICYSFASGVLQYIIRANIRLLNNKQCFAHLNSHSKKDVAYRSYQNRRFGNIGINALRTGCF